MKKPGPGLVTRGVLALIGESWTPGTLDIPSTAPKIEPMDCGSRPALGYLCQ